MEFFSIYNIAFWILSYPVSYVELIATLFGLISVLLATRTNILTWPTGVINEIALFLMFFQLQLYADMFLQVYFLVVTIFGWYNWKVNADSNPVARLSKNWLLIYGSMLIVGTVVIGIITSNLHRWFSKFFDIAASYPFIDSGIMTASILATVLLARKKIETWILWIAIDIVSIGLYAVKGTYILSLEYFVFLGLASAGFITWRKTLVYA